jgi:hypothetical protein
MEVDRDPEAPSFDPEDQRYIQELDSDGEGIWTDVAEDSVDEAEPYYPPTDPPVLPGVEEGAVMATGLGASPEEPPFRGDSPPDRGCVANGAGRESTTRRLRDLKASDYCACPGRRRVSTRRSGRRGRR